MSKVTGLVLAAIGFGAASYVYMTPETEHATSEKLASLVRIAAEGSRPARIERRSSTNTVPVLIADQERSASTSGQTGSIVLAETSNTRNGPAANVVTPRSAGPDSADKATRKFTTMKPVDDETRRALAKSIQTELKRVGCFDAEIDGAWNQSTRGAMKSFIDRINATLPVNEPDYILLTLLQGHQDRICGKGCPTGQLLANDGRCQPKAIVAQADRRVPRRDSTQQGSVTANAPVTSNQVTSKQVAINEEASRKQQATQLEFKARAEAERQAQLRISEENRSKAQAALDDAQRRQEQLARTEADRAARAETDRQQQVRLADERRLKIEMAAEESRRRQLAFEEQQRTKAEAQRLAQVAQAVAQQRLADEQRQRAEAAAEDARRNRLVLEEQQRSKADAQRLAQVRAADELRLKASAAIEEARRKQLVIDEQQRTKAETQRLAQARIADEQRMKVESAAEEARRKQLVAQKPQQPPQATLSLGGPPATQPATQRSPSTTASATETRSMPFTIGASGTGGASASAVPSPSGSATANSANGTPVGARAAGTAIASTEPVVQAAPVPEPQQKSLIADEQKAAIPEASPATKAPGQAKAVRRLDNAGPTPRQQPRYVQRFVPPPYYVGGVTPSSANVQPRAVYAAPSSSYRSSDVFSGLSRNSP